MEADLTFMTVLEDIPDSHRIAPGSDTIQILGGERKPEAANKNGRANRSRGTPSGTIGRGNNRAIGGPEESDESGHTTSGKASCN